MLYYTVTAYFNGSATHQSYGRPKIKTTEPFGSALWPDLPRSRTFAVDDYSCMSGALHIRPNDACNFQVLYKQAAYYKRIFTCYSINFHIKDVSSVHP